MRKFTFILQDPNEAFPATHRFSAASIISAANTVMKTKKFQGFTILDAYCGNRTAKMAYQDGHITYEYLKGKIVEAPVKHIDEPAHPTEFGDLLGEVDDQCGQKKVTD
jgi:hypothetical protein